ncbi:MAG: S26 family signal peptidase [Pseudomonadota bacterium]
MKARRTIAWATTVSVTLIVISAVVQWSPRVLWNVSASVPIGLYRLHPVDQMVVGDLVAVQPPPALSDYLDARGYIPRSVLLLKHVAALEGALVCRSGDAITVDHLRLVNAHAEDRYGRDLPVWRGCHRLGAGEVFLMNSDAPDSFDGRYFGPLPRTAITARLTPLWTVDDAITTESAQPDPTPHHNRKEARHAPDR